ncbi:helix-turn-helix domain-containing protein [Rossellomorea vietnamensis]|uniref:helix-turn-helix domain-containing protein n=1 Tax=Rossellomorea vietnamensis TaxID=218284 RepID=UPI002078D599|nr:helix-turn-helix domain-containing protein [Rossellomorea vietnamensis]
MDKWEMYMEIQQLLKKGFSKTKVADKLGVSRATVYRHLKRSPSETAEWVESLQTRKKKLDPYKELILNWLREHPDLSHPDLSAAFPYEKSDVFTTRRIVPTSLFS